MGIVGENLFLQKEQQLCPESSCALKWEHPRLLRVFSRNTLSPVGHYQVFIFNKAFAQFVIYVY